ncbi:GNAT family N-acetyltransferase [Sabulilitoribacter multivorans]|uniref:GNAT family N-acetyltransferase n=1 Tax=Flaviramulus multivorans TaxID=1304750 RepID=A0ABS9IJM7_9FLAO|nr:GNAT family N-acetyltransferase [Flaviramulus multivorans]MCF7560793.1 GNAT family N-acetyltransferase [Flaviramulus multivorans]
MLDKIKPVTLDVLSTFLERKEALPIYNKIVNTISGTTIYESTKLELDGKSNLYCIYDFPGYLKGITNSKKWKLKVINVYKGSLILLKNYKNTDDYLKHKFSSDRRSKFRTYQKRLETCFNIEYKSYYGKIDKDEYELLFESFHEMIKKRFQEKKIKNYDLTRWQVYYDIAYPLIKNKDAVLFVIFNNKKPISICLNFVRNQTIYGYLRTYDVDYSKFYLGFTDFIKQLDWCFENNIEIFDLLKGSYPYKLRLIDSQYNFQQHILYNSTSVLSTISASFITTKTKAFYGLVRVLKKVKINKLYYKYINYKYRNKELNNNNEDHLKEVTITNNVQINLSDELEYIDINEASKNFPKRLIFNFLYSSKEHFQNIKLFKYKNDANSYLIVGKKKNQKVTLL